MPALVLSQDLVLLAPLPIIYVANLAVDPARPETSRRALALFVVLCIGALALGTLVSGALAWPDARRYGLTLMVTGAVIASLVVPRTRVLCPLLRLDRRNVLHALALALTSLLLGTQLAAQLGASALTQEAHATPLTAVTLIAQELPFLLAALVGVGLLSRRRPAEVARRLGWVRPTPAQVAIGLAAALLFYAIGAGADWLSVRLTPALAHEVASANGRLFGGLMNPLGVATVALGAGICEEALFRGALQPRVGLVLSALVFALLHTQYGLSIDTAAVFVLAIGLGELRRLANTTTSTLTHVSYNTLVGAAFGLSIPILGVAFGVLAAAAWVLRSRVPRSVSSDR